MSTTVGKNPWKISVRFQGKPFNIRVIQINASNTNAKKTEAERLYDDLQSFPELTPKKKKKDVFFIIRDWKAKVGRQEIPEVMEVWSWSAKWSKAKANRVLPREPTGHNKHPLPTTQEMTLLMDINRWSIRKSEWLYSWWLKMEKLYTARKNKTGSRLWLRLWTPYCKILT